LAVLGRLLVGSGERLDLADLLSLDSYVAADFKYLIQSFIGASKPYILYGLDVINPQDAIGTENISLRIAESVVYYPGSQAGAFYYGLPEGNINALPLIPELRKNATNFVYLTFGTFDTAKDSRAFWDPDQNGGDGGEFSQDVNTETALKIEVNVSTSTFPENTIPICKVVVGASVISSIQDCRDHFFRLGTGGVSPNPFSTYDFREDPSAPYARLEPSGTMTSALNPNPFQGGDKNIRTLKEWMDVVMTRIKELGGSAYWYQGSSVPGAGPNVSNVFLDALGSTVKSKGEWQHSSATPGMATWTEDIHYYSLVDARDLIIRADTVTLSSSDRVAWINLKREADLNGIAAPANWLNGATYISGAVGTFVNLSKGDWVKKPSDPNLYFRRVEELALDALGTLPTSAATATYAVLGAPYLGTSGIDIGQYTKGEYKTLDIENTNRNDPLVAAAGGNFFWLAYRTDTSLGLFSAIRTTLSLAISDHDGERAKVTSVAHGLVDGDRITVAGSINYNGTYDIEYESADVFSINKVSALLADEAAVSGYYAIITTAARSTAYGYSLETANHGFKSGEQVTLAGAGVFNGSYVINYRTATTFQIPVASALVSIVVPIDGEIVNLPRLNVRTEFGTVKVVQGESTSIGDMDSENILSFIGMDSLAEVTPEYNILGSYNALNGHQNYNSLSNDSLKTRVSRLSAMMADRVQDRGMQIIGRTNIVNKTNGGNQEISAIANLTLKKPSNSDLTISLTSPVVLAANTVALIDIDRDGSGSVVPTIESWGSSYLIGENKIILFYRFADTTVYAWDGQAIPASGHLNLDYPEDSQNRNIFVFNPGTAKLNTSSGLLTLDVKEGAEKTRVKVLTASSVPQSSYFVIHSAYDAEQYVIWYNKDTLGVQPIVAGTTAYIPVAITTGDTATQVRDATISAINGAGSVETTASIYSSDTLSLVNDFAGPATDIADGTTATTFQFTIVQQGVDPDITIVIPGSANNTIDVDAINALGTLVLADGKSAWVRINRFAAKTFNTVLTVDSVDTDIAGTIYITNTSAVPIDQDVFVLWTRSGDNLLITHLADDPRGNVYEEYLTVVSAAPGVNEVLGPLVINDELQLPVDSRDSSNVQEYIVGSGQLEVFLNGVYLKRGEDYAEVGDSGTLSKRIQTLQSLVVGDLICFRIDAQGAVYFAASSGGGATLQDAYDAGRFISVAAGQPVVITGGSGKLLDIQGDITVTGVIDPAGITFSQEPSDPLGATDYGIWRNASDEFVFKKGASAPINLNTDFLRRDGSLAAQADINAGNNKVINVTTPAASSDAATKGYVDDFANKSVVYISLANNTGGTVVAGTLVAVSQSVAGELVVANANSLNTSVNFVGVVKSNILNGASGYVQVAGIATVLGGALSLGQRVYLSDSVAGNGTSTAPTSVGSSIVLVGIATSTTSVVLMPRFEAIIDN